MTIRNFSDHAANERTFLAWVRTAIAVMAFGFVVEKADLFLRFAGLSLGVHGPHAAHERLAGIAAMALLGFGALLLGIATHRFLKTAKEIDSPEVVPGPGSRIDIVLASLLFVLGACLFLYLAQNLIANF